MTSTLVYGFGQIPEHIKNIIGNDLENVGILDYEEIYEEQLDYFNYKSIADYSYFIAGFYNDKYIGGVCLFLNTDGIIDTPSPGIQAIAKSVYGLTTKIKLNEVLIPAIIEYLKKIGYNKVYVDPIRKQKKILLDYYGFEEVFLEDTECKILVKNFENN